MVGWTAMVFGSYFVIDEWQKRRTDNLEDGKKKDSENDVQLMKDYEIENGQIIEIDDDKKKKSFIFRWLKTFDDCLRVVIPANWVDKFWNIIDYFVNKRNPSV